MPYPSPRTSFAQIDDLIMGTVAARAVLEAVHQRLFDLTVHPATLADLADRLGFKPDILEALLHLLAHHGLLEHGQDGWTNTDLSSEFLVSDAPLFQGLSMELQQGFNDMLINDMTALMRGETPARKQTDDSWAEDQVMKGTLQHALAGQLQQVVAFLAGLPEFPAFRDMADIGGNHGKYSLELLLKNPDLRSTVHDLPKVVQTARKQYLPENVSDRLGWSDFDLHQDRLPEESCDLVLTSHVLYACSKDLDRVLGMIHAALRPGGVLATHHFAPEGGASANYRTALELTTRLMGYDTHFLAREVLEPALVRAGFTNITHTFTGMDKQGLLLAARKAGA